LSASADRGIDLIMKKKLMLVGLLVATCALLAGCGKESSNAAGGEMKGFGNASAEVKQAVDEVAKAEKANDYVAANAAYMVLLHLTLTPEQTESAQAAFRAMNARMFEAANQGDEAAKKALEAIQASRRAR
jgi:hypothetical protein